MSAITDIYTIIRNATLNSMGVERTLEELLADKDIGRVKNILQNRDSIVEEAIKQYQSSQHSIHRRMDKARSGKNSYRVEKLPRARQRYINEVELFFLLGNPIIWSLVDEKNDNGFAEFKDMLKSLRFDSIMRQAKRIAGAETEAAILFHIYREDDFKPSVKPVVLSHSAGYTLRPLFDQFGNMLAFGYGYNLNENGKTVEHFDLQTATHIYTSNKTATGWEVEAKPNPTGKINVVYIQQTVAWEGVQERCDREEHIDSRIADTNNYFADPMAVATADVIDSLAAPDRPGKLIQLTGDNSKFDYINPPMASDLQAAEKAELNRSILFDSFTPDLSFEAMKGMGTLSGEAIKRAMALGYIKRANLEEIYSVAVDRAKNIILAIMEKVTHINIASMLDSLSIEHRFAEPFNDDSSLLWQNVGRAYNDGIISLEKAVQMLGLSENPEKEIERIKQAKAESMTANLFEPTI
jgi:hypothetical protein